MNHRDEVIAVFAVGGPISVEMMDQLMLYAHTQCMENANMVNSVINNYAHKI